MQALTGDLTYHPIADATDAHAGSVHFPWPLIFSNLPGNNKTISQIMGGGPHLSPGVYQALGMMLGPFALCLLNLLFEVQRRLGKGPSWDRYAVYNGMASPILQLHCRLHEDDLLALHAPMDVPVEEQQSPDAVLDHEIQKRRWKYYSTHRPKCHIILQSAAACQKPLAPETSHDPLAEPASAALLINLRVCLFASLFLIRFAHLHMC